MQGTWTILPVTWPWTGIIGRLLPRETGTLVEGLGSVLVLGTHTGQASCYSDCAALGGEVWSGPWIHLKYLYNWQAQLIVQKNFAWKLLTSNARSLLQRHRFIVLGICFEWLQIISRQIPCFVMLNLALDSMHLCSSWLITCLTKPVCGLCWHRSKLNQVKMRDNITEHCSISISISFYHL